MEHTRETTSAAFKAEPADGTTLVIRKSTYGDGDPEWVVIWRNDADADRWYDGDADGQHWFRANDETPMELHQYLKYADAVYTLGEETAKFADSDDGED